MYAAVESGVLHAGKPGVAYELRDYHYPEGRKAARFDLPFLFKVSPRGHVKCNSKIVPSKLAALQLVNAKMLPHHRCPQHKPASQYSRH